MEQSHDILILCAEDSETELRAEVARAFGAVPLNQVKPLLFSAGIGVAGNTPLPFLPHARQIFPDASPITAESIRAWSEEMLGRIIAQIPEGQPWALYVAPVYGVRQVHHVGARAWHSLSHSHALPRTGKPEENINAEAGRHRCELIRNTVVELLRKRRRHLLKTLRSKPAPFTPDDSLVQACLTGPDAGFISIVAAPGPLKMRHALSFLPMGRFEAAPDKNAPSRAFAKLVESEVRLGRQIKAGETCVDLGAAPGSWTYVAVERGAHVLAVDRSPLREDLMRSPHVDFIAHDAFRFAPPRTVDWLLCDVIVEPQRTLDLLLQWLRKNWTRAFVVTLKLKDSPESLDTLERAAKELGPLVSELRINKLCANKKEVSVFGYRR